jgi:predicted phage tail protein
LRHALALSLAAPARTIGKEALTQSIRKDIGKTMDVEKEVQALKANWTDESKDMADKLEQLNAQTLDLEKGLAKQSLALAVEEKKYRENLRREKEVLRITTQLAGFLDSVLDKLDAAIEQDLPFLAKERSGRITALREMMVDPDESTAEKFRRVFEALQIETEYGTTVEVTQETINLENQDIMADIFRLGRVSLFCQSIDRKKSGVFDLSSGQWHVLPENTNQELTRAIAMARLERSIELVKLPLGRIVNQ